ncbi:MAG: histidine kinase dimerization/phospho-acceptor domain-containing protein [Lachnospirales bacterium]
MNKLSKKLILGIVTILVLSFVCSLIFNSQYLERFYLYQKKNTIINVCDNFINSLEKHKTPKESIKAIEDSYKVIIVEIDSMPAEKNDEVNEKIQSAFQEKGIGFQKYWFWEEDYKYVLKGENKIKLYNQEKLNYSLLVNYTKVGSSIYAITMIVPNISDAFHIANMFLITVHVFTIIIAVIFIIFFTKKITRPLQLFQLFARNMNNNNFVPINVSTKDELEIVAESLNTMGKQVSLYQKSLEEKNSQMEQLIEGVAHDLKTPIALIDLYGNGIKDGIDDGEFLETILEENKRMATMIDRLIFLSKVENVLKEQLDSLEINLSSLLNNIVNKHRGLTDERQMKFHLEIEVNIHIKGNSELLESLFLNLITNAIKYSTGETINLKLFKKENAILFYISNKISNDYLDLDKIWLPYYVGEKSRNKKLSGTGLGLSIVKKICDTQGFSINCNLVDNKIEFIISILQ